jgi:hypothetical protein
VQWRRELTWHAWEALRGEDDEGLSEGLREDRGDIGVYSIATRFWSRRPVDRQPKLLPIVVSPKKHRRVSGCSNQKNSPIDTHAPTFMSLRRKRKVPNRCAQGKFVC